MRFMKSQPENFVCQKGYNEFVVLLPADFFGVHESLFERSKLSTSRLEGHNSLLRCFNRIIYTKTLSSSS